jgi:small-conductance mechanosensitive channel
MSMFIAVISISNYLKQLQSKGQFSATSALFLTSRVALPGMILFLASLIMRDA